LRKENYRVGGSVAVGDNGRIVRLTPQEAETLLAENQRGAQASGVQVSGGRDNEAGGSQDNGSEAIGRTASQPSNQVLDKLLSELRLALKASKAGIERVHIIDGRESGALLRELFSNLGAGTMIYQDEYESIRQIRTQDIPDVLRIMEPLMHQGVLIRRNSEDIQEKKNDYAVFEIDGSVHACGALHEWGEAQGEIAAIATDPAYADMGLGRRVVRYLMDRALKQGLHRVFVLTTRTHDWFESLGFRECPVESLPPNRRKKYDQNRKSKVFALDL
jgi:amino-acid N-acetyltransferase